MLLSSLVISSYILNRLGYKFWYKGSHTMVWALRLWGVSSLVMLVTFLLPSMHSWAPAEAVRSSQFDFERLMQDSSSRLDPADYIVRIREPFSGVQSFQEAPAFRNGIQCLPQKGFKLDEVCDPTSVHIAMTLDKTYLRGSIAAVFSVVKHAICPENIIFHFLVSSNEQELKNTVRTTFPYLRFKVYFFDEEIVRHRISSSVREDLEQPLNYARNYLADILEPCIQRVIYLDSDLVVVDDIGKLWGITLGPHTIGAPEYCHANFTKYFTDSFWNNKSLSSIFQGRKPCYYNTGVMVMDLARWRQEDYTRTIEKWMDIQKENKIYELGSLPPFLLVFGGLLEQIDHRWNQHGLGGDNRVGSCRALHPGPVSLLHWSGKGKPWLRIDSGTPCPLDSLWAPYDLFLHPFQDHSSS